MAKVKPQYSISFDTEQYKVVAFSNIKADKPFFNIEEVKQSRTFKVLNSLSNVDLLQLQGVYVDIKPALPTLKEALQHELAIDGLPEVVGAHNCTGVYATFILLDQQIDIQFHTIAIIQTNSKYFSIDEAPNEPSKYRLNISMNLLTELDVTGYISISSF